MKVIEPLDLIPTQSELEAWIQSEMDRAYLAHYENLVKGIFLEGNGYISEKI